jgi:hypothetical protein
MGAESYVGWWRIDPATGNTLGINSNGWGAAQVWDRLVRYQSEITLAALVAEGFIEGYYFCNNHFDYSSRCLEQAVLNALFRTSWWALSGGFDLGPVIRDSRGGIGPPGGRPPAGQGPTGTQPPGGRRPGGVGPTGTQPLGGRPADAAKTQPDLGKTLPQGEPPIDPIDPSKLTYRDIEAARAVWNERIDEAFKAEGEWIRYQRNHPDIPPTPGYRKEPNWDPDVDGALARDADQKAADMARAGDNLHRLEDAWKQKPRPAGGQQSGGGGAQAPPCPQDPCSPAPSPMAKSIGGMMGINDILSPPKKP